MFTSCSAGGVTRSSFIQRLESPTAKKRMRSWREIRPRLPSGPEAQLVTCVSTPQPGKGAGHEGWACPLAGIDLLRELAGDEDGFVPPQQSGT